MLRDLNYKLIAPSYLFGACAESLVGALCTILQNEIFVPGQIICREGDMMRQMWFLMDGFVSFATAPPRTQRVPGRTRAQLTRSSHQWVLDRRPCEEGSCCPTADPASRLCVTR